MKKIPLTQGEFALVDDDMFAYLSQWKWYLSDTGYAERKPVSGKVIMHRDIMGNPKGKQIDHINGNRLDNRRENLRVCNRSQNAMNTEKRSTNKSGYKGVSLDGKSGKWVAHIRNTYVGGFHDIVEAARAYDAKARELFGDFAKLNFPDQPTA